MENKESLKKINELIDGRAKVLVGILLKRIEVLEKEKTLSPNLYKALVREHIYEEARNLKRFLEIYLTIGQIKFITKKPRGQE